MRTTLRFDADVALLLKREQVRRRQSLRQIVNDALREGLAPRASGRRPWRHDRTPSVSLGRCLIGTLDDVAEAVALAEGNTFR